MKSPKEIDWRKDADATDFDADDSEMDETPKDIVEVLGFDPAKE